MIGCALTVALVAASPAAWGQSAAPTPAESPAPAVSPAPGAGPAPGVSPAPPRPAHAAARSPSSAPTPTPAELLRARAAAALDGADEALALGDAERASSFIELASAYLESPLFARARRGARSVAARADRFAATSSALDDAALAAARSRLAAVRAFLALREHRDAARVALDRARAARRPTAEPFRAAESLARTCAEGADQVPDPVDRTFVVTGEGSLATLAGSCRELAQGARDEAMRAALAAAARDAELRTVLRGERLTTYESLGEPDRLEAGVLPGDARVWIYVKGPDGPLRRYDTLTITFAGERVVSRRRVTTYGSP